MNLCSSYTTQAACTGTCTWITGNTSFCAASMAAFSPMLPRFASMVATCETAADNATCVGIGSCVWTGTSSRCDPSSTILAQSVPPSQTWTSPISRTFQGQFGCAMAATNQSTCNATGGNCTWMTGSNNVSLCAVSQSYFGGFLDAATATRAATCESVTDQTVCTANADCVWWLGRGSSASTCRVGQKIYNEVLKCSGGGGSSGGGSGGGGSGGGSALISQARNTVAIGGATVVAAMVGLLLAARVTV